MKILLLTDVPPCSNYTGGLVLEKLVNFLPKDNIVIASVTNPSIHPLINEKFNSVNKLFIKKPREAGLTLFNNKFKFDLLGFFFELIQGARVRFFILPQIVRFATLNNIDILWIVLQGQTMIRLSRPLSKKLKIPFVAQIWDMPEWFLRAHNVDKYTQKKILKEFDRVLMESRSIASASWGMRMYFSKKYSIPSEVIISCLPSSYKHLPLKKITTESKFTIGMAGQFYATNEWNALMDSLNKLNWKILGREIRIRVMGAYINAHSHQPVNIEYLGWNNEKDTINLLSECDILYLPYWFSKDFKKEAMTSFPSKLVLYFASGRPVFCHAPIYSSPYKYILNNKAGFLCNSLSHDIIIDKLKSTITNKKDYKRFSFNGSLLFSRDLNLRNMKKSFLNFISPKP